MPANRLAASLLALAVSVVLTACGPDAPPPATPYKSMRAAGTLGGYDEKQLETAIWRVGFTGTPATTRETAQTYWLYRSAELTLERGYAGFEVVSDLQLGALSWGHPQYAKSGGVMFVPMYGGGHGGGGMAERTTIEADIRLLPAPFASNPPRVFDAARLKAVLQPVVMGRKCEEGNVCPHHHAYLSSAARAD